MAKDFAIVLNNGGVNSAVATSLAAQKFRPILLYVESTTSSSRQRAAYDQQVTYFKPFREHTVTLPALPTVRPTNEASTADPRLTSPLATRLIDMLGMLAVAAQYAAQYQAGAIYSGMRIGPDGDDLAQATEFFQIWAEMLQIPLRLAELDVATPLLELEPWQVVDVGFQTSVPFERTWSCQHEASDPCWTCRGCREREAAFVQAAKPDPLKSMKRA